MTPHDAPSWLPTLDSTAISHALDIDAAAAGGFLDLPARPGVAIFEGADGATLLIATTADLRELARRRLGDPATPAEIGLSAPRADHRAITRRILAVEVGSALEADIVYLAQARLRMPDTHRHVSERWRAWFVQVDPDAEFPQWYKTCLTGGVAARSASRAIGVEFGAAPGVLLGPFADKDAAGRFIELVIDAFDLCREYPLLVQAPRARACPYKEMGRCPAPCDGSEPMPSYRLRTRRAVDAITGGLDEMRNRLAADMASAAAATAFEHAAELKQQLLRLEALAKPAFAHATDVRRWRAALVLPAPGRGRLRLLVLAGARLGEVGVFEAGASAQSLEPLASRSLEAAADAPPFEPEPAQLDTLAALTRWLYTASSRRRGVCLNIEHDVTPAGLATLIARGAKSLRKAEDLRVPDQAIEP